MRSIEKTYCKLSASKWQCQCPHHLQNKKHLSTVLLLDFAADSSRCGNWAIAPPPEIFANVCIFQVQQQVTSFCPPLLLNSVYDLIA